MDQVMNQFGNPAMRYRPKMRWWLPGAFMDNAEIKREIEWMAKAGYGGAEIIHFFAIPTTDVEPQEYGKYGFGSDEWNDRMKAALQAAIPLGFQLDFTVGPLWPIATPAVLDKDDPRCTQGLHIGIASFTGEYRGPIPASETIDAERASKLVAVTAARKHNGTSVGGQITYELESALDLTSLVVEEGSAYRVEWTPPSEGEWHLFGLWSQTNGQMNDSAGAPVLDHFSEEAVRAVVGYWDERLLGDRELRALYEKNAGCLFCDSIELNATMLGGMYGGTPMTVVIWSPKLLEEFKSRRGYDLTPYLPSIFVKGLYQLCDRETDGDSELDSSDRSANQTIRNDFFQTLTEMFRDRHLRTLREWANGHNMKLRYQTYGMPTELTAGLLEVDVPETESLGFGDSTDGYRFQSGAVHMAEKEVYSIEVGAVMGYGYNQSWTGHDFGMLWQIHRGFAAGVNQAVFHGMSYESTSAAGHFAASFQWPGLSLMGTMFSNEWGERQPYAAHAGDLTGYVSRNQMILRTGAPKVDLAVYRYHIDGVHHGMGTEATVYEKAGYSYDFVSPALLNLERATVGMFDERPALFADGAAYRALIVDMRRNTDDGEWMPQAMPSKTADRLLEYAEAGLPIVIVGESPFMTESYKGSRERMSAEDAKLRERMERLRGMPAVRVVSTQAEATEALANGGVRPSVVTEQGSHLLSVRRFDRGTDYYFLFNPDMDTTFEGTVTLTGEGRLYRLNAWDGTISKAESDAVGDGRRRTKVRLAPNATAIFVISDEELTGSGSVEEANLLSDRREIKLERWSLEVESWSAGPSPTETNVDVVSLELSELKPWPELPGLERASGIGRYTTTFLLEESEPFGVAVLELGAVNDTFRLKVNGMPLPPANQIDRRASIGSWLRPGLNTIEVEVATSLNNALSASDPKRVLQSYGLLGPVSLGLKKRLRP